MCGICGIASDWLTVGDKKMFMELMHLNVLRGWEGAGIIMIPEKKKDEIQVIRTTDTGTDLILSKEFHKAWELCRYSALIGHCRFPTKGDNTIENVHPFEIKHIIGVHNGTFRRIDNVWLTDKESDTKKIYEEIAEKGIEAAIKDSDGAYALNWVDTEKRTINFLRNLERPLHVTKTGAFCIWSSEGTHIGHVLSRNNRQGFKIDFFASDKHYMMEYPCKPPYSFRDGGKIKPVRFWEGKKEYDDVWSNFTEPRDNFVSNRNRTNFNHVNAARHNGNGDNVRDLFNRAATIRNDALRRHFLPPSVPDPVHSPSERVEHQYNTSHGYWVTKDKLNQYLKNGCAYCSEETSMADYLLKKIFWLNSKEFLCETCLNSPAVVDEMLNYHPGARNDLDAYKAERKAS